MPDTQSPLVRAGYEAPASLGQERLHLAEMLRPGRSAYAMSYALRLDGPLVPPLVGQAVAAILARHDGLRAHFISRAEGLCVFVPEDLPIEIPLEDVSAFPEATWPDAVRGLLGPMTAAPFDLAAGPLLRLCLIRCATDVHVLGLAAHHTIADGQSLQIFRHAFAAAYADLARGRPPSLAELPIQFADFAEWERLEAGGPEAAAHAAYWHERLAGAPAILPLPLDREADDDWADDARADDARESATVSRDLPGAAAAALLGVARARRATPAMAFLTIFAALMARWAQAEDLVVAMPLSKRSRPELTGLIGLLVDLLPIRIAVPATATAETLLDQVRDGVSAAMRHSALPFERIIERARAARHAESGPFQQLLFGFEDGEDAPLAPSAPRMGLEDATGLAVSEWTELPEQDAKADLSILVQRTRDGWRLSLRYPRACLPAAAAARLLDAFAMLCSGVAVRPDARLATLAMAPVPEMRTLWERLNRTERPFPSASTLAALFEAVAAARPHAPSLTVHDGMRTRSLDYDTLNRAANRIAHHLEGRGVAAGDRVGLALPDAVDFVTAMLATIKLGAAYVPLDPDLPAARCAAMLESARVTVVLTAGETLPAALAEGRMVIDLRQAQAEIAQASPGNPHARGMPAGLACIMFTSGSTGMPKGVAVPQRAVTRLVRESDFLAITPDDTVSFAANTAFDASTLEIWGALLNGARLLQVPHDTLLSAAALAGFIARERLSVLWVTKGLFDQLVRSDPACFRGLRVLLTGGDAASPAAFGAVLAANAGGDLALLNGYGPTENTTFSTVWRAEAALPKDRPVPVGRPIANSRAYVLDAGLNLLPPGMAGELHVAGWGLADGYCGQPDLTAERFLPDPFGPPGSRMYRTGDLARLRDDGAIAYLGRGDDQVKIRGFRIELGEIAAALERHPAVGASHIAVREDAETGRHLVAYAVPRPGAAPTAAELRLHLAGHLPGFMLPRAIRVLPALPLNARGKVDREALLLTGTDDPAAPVQPPQGPTETALGEIWARLLQRTVIDRGENFFALGGDSILTIRLAARARERGLPVTPKLVFQHQTIAGLAGALDGLLGAGRPCRSPQALPLIGTPYRLWRLLGTPRGTAWVAGWARLARPLDAISFGLALQDLRRRHDALRLHLGGEHGSRVLGLMAEPPPVPVSLHRLLPGDVGTQRNAIVTRLAVGLDPLAGRVLRGALVQGAEGAPYLLLVAHRLVADEASVALLLDDLGRSIVTGRRAGLGYPPTPFVRWIERLAAYAESPEAGAQSATWDAPSRRDAARRASGSPPEPRAVGHAERSLSGPLGAAFAPAALAARRITPLEAVLAAVAGALTSGSGGESGEDLLIDVVSDGRAPVFDDLDMAATVGSFSRRIPVLVQAGDASGAHGRLARAKSALRALPDAGLGFELLDRDLCRLPRGRVVLVDGLAAGPRPMRAIAAAFDVLQEAELLGQPLVEADACVTLRLERAAEGIRLRAAVDGDPGAFLDVVCLWLERLLLGKDGPLTNPVQTPEDFPLAGLDEATLPVALGAGDDIADLYPLSPMQESMLIHALTAPGSEIGFEQACQEIEGPLQVAAFIAAWQSAMDRHPILRSAFVWDGLPRPLQRVHARLAFPAHLDDWSDLSTAVQAERRAALLAEDRRRGFRLDRPPLLRASLVRLAPMRFLFVASYHHILLDGWCLPQLEREVRQAYEAAVAGQPLHVRASRPFSDYVAWLQRQDPSASRRYFAGLLTGWPGPEPLPQRTPDAGPYRLAAPHPTQVELVFPAAEVSRLVRFARSECLTMGALLHAAWGLLLMQLCGRRDVVFGTTVSGRPAELPGVETMLGLFINNLPVRLAVEPAMPAARMLAALQTQLMELRQHEAVPALDIEAAAPPLHGGRLFDTLLVVENLPSSLEEWAASPTLRVRLLSAPLKTGYALTMVAIPGDGLRLALIYDAARFEAAAAEDMLAEMRRLLLGLTEGQRPVDALLASSPTRPARPVAPLPPLIAAAAVGMPPRTTAEARVAEIVCDLLGLDAIGVTTDLVSCGLASVTVGRLAMRLRAAFGRAVPLTVIIGRATVAQLADLVAGENGKGPAASETPWQPLVPMGGGTAARSFYCVHPIAGDVSVFFDLARALAPTRRFVALQAPGLRRGDPAPESVEALAALYVDRLIAEGAEPIDIGGYSFGGVVAFEIARQMAMRGRPPRRVVIIDTPAPGGGAAAEDDYTDAQWLWRMLRVRERFHDFDLGLTLAEIERAGEAGAYALVLGRLRESGLLPETADGELLMRMAAVGRRHYRLYRAYSPAPIGTPVAVVRAATLNGAEAEIDRAGRFACPDLGWAALTRGPVAVAVTPGNHVTMMRPPDLAALATTILRLLDQTLPAATPAGSNTRGGADACR